VPQDLPQERTRRYLPLALLRVPTDKFKPLASPSPPPLPSHMPMMNVSVPLASQTKVAIKAAGVIRAQQAKRDKNDQWEEYLLATKRMASKPLGGADAGEPERPRAGGEGAAGEGGDMDILPSAHAGETCLLCPL
jgi:hypothetical protein